MVGWRIMMSHDESTVHVFCPYELQSPNQAHMLWFHLQYWVMAEQKMRAHLALFFEFASCCSARIWSTVDSLLASKFNFRTLQ